MLRSLTNMIRPIATKPIEYADPGWIDAAFKADELCKNYRPILDFTTFCLYHDLTMKWREYDDEPYKTVFKIEVHLILSEDEITNQKAKEMLQKLDIYYIEQTYEFFMEWKHIYWPESDYISSIKHTQ